MIPMNPIPRKASSWWETEVVTNGKLVVSPGIILNNKNGKETCLMRMFHTSSKTIASVACLAMLMSGCGASAIDRTSLSTSALNPFSEGESSGQGVSYEDQLLGDNFSAPAATSSTPAPQTAAPAGNSAKTADFETYGIPCILQLNEDYICPAIIEKDYSQHSQGTLTVIQYDVKPVSDDIWEFGQKNGCDFTGYEMRAVTTQIDFTPEYTGGKNVSIMRRTMDYYNMDAPDNGTWHKDHLDRDFLEYEVEWQGQKRPAYFWLRSFWKDYDTYYEYKEDAIFFVPAGYDGAVRGFINPDRPDKDLKNYHPEQDVLLFRLQ